MKKTRIELLPDVYLTILDTDQFRTNLLSVTLLRPLCREEASLNALLPDVLLRGCGMCPDMGAISAWLDQRYGAGIQAAVRKKGEVQGIGFIMDYIDEKFVPGESLTQDICALMGSFLLDPVTENGVFRRDYVDGEKVNLINAILSQINDKRTYAAMRLREEMFSCEAYGVGKNGAQVQVEEITPDKLFAHYQYILAHSRVEIMFAGRAEQERLKDYLIQALQNLPRGKIDPVSTDLGPDPEDLRELSESMDLKQGTLVMGFRTGITSADPGYPALLLLNGIFGGGITSKLFRQVRESMSLCYYASSGLDRFKGIMLVSSGIDTVNYQAARDEILHQMSLCQAGEITEEEILSARKAICSALRSGGDSLGRLEDFYLSQEIGGFTYNQDQLIRSLEQVTKAEIVAAAGNVKPDTFFFLKGAE